MIGLVSLRWVLTVAFAGAAVFHLVGCLRSAGAEVPRCARRRTSEALHLIMSVSMIAMVWPWGEVVPRSVWLVVFAGATAWFAGRAVASPGRRRLAPAFFATATAAMAWMCVAMPATAGGHHPGMATAAGAGPPIGYAAWVSAGLGGYLVGAAAWWIARGMRIGGLSTAGAAVRPPHWPAVCHGVTSVGMGLALLAMA